MANFEGLLHLSAIATAVAVAYVGLDRIHWDDERFAASLAAAEQDAAKALVAYDIKPSEKYPKTVFDDLPFWTRVRLVTLCILAKVTVEKRVCCNIAHKIHYQINFPMFKYFRNRWDRWLIKKLAIVSLFVFLFVSALATWELESILLFGSLKCSYWPIFSFDVCASTQPISTKTLIPYLYSFFAATLIWVCMTGAMSQRLQNIRTRCSVIDGAITKTLSRLKKNLVPRWLKSAPPPEMGDAVQPVTPSPASDSTPRAQ
jgi:hypothetical protein